uniref:BTB domain-containing protein n=1 Tax=Panagrellus redivivus TaxID=6233 RepID=A0A7E4ZQK3_PANRE
MLAVQRGFACKEVQTFTLRKADLKKPIGECLESPNFAVPNSGGLKWSIDVYPTGETDECKGYISVFINVNKPVKSKCRCTVNGSSIEGSFAYEFSYSDPPLNFGWEKFASHKSLYSFFHMNKLTFTCIIELNIATPRDVLVPHGFQFYRHVPPDFEFVIGSEQVPAHKNFLLLISPVLKAMLSDDTAESKPSKIHITEFTLEAVKCAIDFCYGRELGDLSIKTAVSVLRFCDQYFMAAVAEELGKLSLFDLTIDSFCEIARYAHECHKKDLLDECCYFFKGHHGDIKAKPEFVDLPPILVVDVLKKAFDLKTEFDVLDHAHRNGISFVVDYLEESLVEAISLDNFCPAVRYAWKCSRDSLKNACAQFLINNREEVTDSKDFLDLSADVVRSILKVAHEMKRKIV